MNKNKLEDKGVEILAPYLTGSRSIVHVSLASNDISPKGYQIIKTLLIQLGGKILFKSLIYNESINCLDVSSIEGLHRNVLNEGGICYIKNLLEYNRQLTFLNLSSTIIGNQGIQKIAEGMIHNCTLASLKIASNYIDSAGIPYLIHLFDKRHLIEIDISGNNLGDVVRLLFLFILFSS